MSRQYSYIPDEPEVARPARGKKVKNWCLWQKWRRDWWRMGRYRTQAEAEKAMRLDERKWDAMFKNSPMFQKIKKKRQYKVLHEKDGKPS
jgi:hypothetical protein